MSEQFTKEDEITVRMLAILVLVAKFPKKLIADGHLDEYLAGERAARDYGNLMKLVMQLFPESISQMESEVCKFGKMCGFDIQEEVTRIHPGSEAVQ